MNSGFPQFLPFLGFTTVTVPGGGIYVGHEIELKGLFVSWFDKSMLIYGTAELKDCEPF